MKKVAEPLEDYGLQFPSNVDQLQIELFMFRRKDLQKECGTERYAHYRRICEILWPQDELSPWAEKMQREFCGESVKQGEPLHVAVSGPASAGKSTEAARFAVVWMLMAPGEFAVPVTSTSVQMSKKRIWAYIKTMWMSAKETCKRTLGYEIPGWLVDSSAQLQSRKGDDQHAIAIVPGSQAYNTEGIGKLKGWHAKFVLILADELQDMTEEVIEGCVNMQSGTEEFIFIGLGNGQSWLNTFGKVMMPRGGNPEDVNVEMERWETRDGICLHLDGLKSPNILNPGPVVKGVQQNPYPYLQTQHQIDKIIQKHGEDSVQYWQMVRGFPPPDDSFSAVVSESLLIKFGCMKDQPLMPGWQWYAGLDPAFGGDGCILKFAKVGTFLPLYGEEPRMGIVSAHAIAIKLVASKDQPEEFQIAEQVMKHCSELGIEPRNFSGDGTGTGRGAMAVIREKWSPVIHVVQFGGGASDLPVSNIDSTPCIKAYWDRVTELYYSMKTFVMNHQVRGLTQAMARGFGCRSYKTDRGRYKLQSKSEARAALGRSPDEEDAFVTIIDNLRHQGYFAGPMGFNNEWQKMVKEASMDAEYSPTDELLLA